MTTASNDPSAKSQNKPFWGLPEEVQFCTRCTISNQRPRSVVEFKSSAGEKKPVIGFNEEGVCAACQYNDTKAEIDWEERERKLIEVCDRFRSRNGSYDCIVPSSGGKDSSFTAHVLKFKYGMNPLTVTWAPHMYTDIGWKNFHSLIESGIDNYLYTPNGKFHRQITQLAFKNLVHPFQPFIIGQKLIAPRMAAFYKVPLIFYGENQAEYGNALEENESPLMDTSFFAGEANLDQLYLGGVSCQKLIQDHGVEARDLNPYLPIEESLISDLDIQVRYLGYYLKWDPQECFYYASEYTGFQANTERTDGTYSKYSSIDDKLDVLHFFTTYIKFGIGRATYDTAQEIRNEKITREEGVALVKRYDHEPPKRYFKDILNYLEMSEDEFWSVIDGARSPHLWDKTDSGWRLKHACYYL